MQNANSFLQISKQDNQPYAVKVIDKSRLTEEERDFLL